ncbi:midnolin homolog isoform X2 [Diprion similis]|uniref:midnolin homolog isoform X2 n=1 Tax=Diprion similis TaxID=362088 RepID=UPI001EF8B76C|nr:midnolin homolog isoform X2 [Diprion similis]
MDSSSSETPSDTAANSSGESKNGSKNGGGNRDPELEPEGVRTSPMSSNAASTLTSRRDGGRSPSLSPSPSPSPSLSLSSSPPGCGCTAVIDHAEEITITLDPTTGGHFKVSVDRTESIENLKRIISKRLKVAKERICLLHRERQLRGGTLEENYIQDGSRLTLLPIVETGLLAQRPEQSVMQALESLNDSQVNDFLSGKAPLNLTMRLGDHMMLIQLQLSTVTPAAPAGGPSGSTPATTMSSSSTMTVNAGNTSSFSSSSTTQSRRSYVIPAPRISKTPSKLQGNNQTARTSSLIGLASILQAESNCDSNLSSSTTTTTTTTTMESSGTPTCNAAAAVASKSTTSSPRNSTASPTNLEHSPIRRTHYCTTDSPASPSPSPPPSAQSSPSSTPTVSHFPRSGGGSPLSTSGGRQSCILHHHNHNHYHHSHHYHSHSHSHSHSHHHSRNKLLSFDPLQPSTSSDPTSSTLSVTDAAASQQHSSTLGTPQKKKLCTNHHHHQQQQEQQQQQQHQHQTQQIDLERNGRKIDKESGSENGVLSLTSCTSLESPNGNNAIDGGKPTATLDTRALVAASRNLTQTLKQLSSEDNSKPRQGAIIESMHHHGKGVYSGTFSGTLNPALQDRYGRPKRDISTIIHILNDLLCATPAAAAGHYRHHHRHSHAAIRQQQSSATISTTTTTTTTTTTYTTEELSKENAATKGKMKRLRLVMEQRRAKRKARRQARAAPYTTQWAAVTPNPDNTSTSATTNSNTNTEPQSEPELQPCSPEPVVA